MELTLTADDYGLAPAVNAGIERLAQGVFLSAVSVMVHRDAALDTVAALARTGVATGLHLVLVEERPLTEAAALRTADGRLPRDYRQLFARLLTRPGAARAVRLELEAQLQRYEQLGLPLDFVNGHQHAHEFPLVWRELRELLSRRAPVPLRSAAAGPLALSRQGALGLSARLSQRLWPLPAGHPRLTPLGVDFAGHATLASIDALLERCVDGAPRELVLHPGDEDEALRRRYEHWGYHWQQERDLLCSEALAALFARRGVTLARGRRAAAPGA